MDGDFIMDGQRKEFLISYFTIRPFWYYTFGNCFYGEEWEARRPSFEFRQGRFAAPR